MWRILDFLLYTGDLVCRRSSVLSVKFFLSGSFWLFGINKNYEIKKKFSDELFGTSILLFVPFYCNAMTTHCS